MGNIPPNAVSPPIFPAIKNITMPKRHRQLFETITSPEVLHQAWLRASKGKRTTHSYLVFNEHAPAYLAEIRHALTEELWRPLPVREFLVYEPKQRTISAPSFQDRIVQHAIHAVIEPIFEATFFPRSYACRAEKGTHHGVRRLQADLRRLTRIHGDDVWFLKTDFRSYFHSIDRAILWSEIRQRIACPSTLRLIALYVPENGTGLGIGSLLSQIFANVYGHIMDRHVTNDGETAWHRYMDDIVILRGGPSAPRDLSARQRSMCLLAHEQMNLHFSKWSIQHVSRGVNFLGYRTWHTHKLLRRDSVLRAKRKLRHIRKHSDLPALVKFCGSFTGHAIHADSHHLLKHLALI